MSPYYIPAQQPYNPMDNINGAPVPYSSPVGNAPQGQASGGLSGYQTAGLVGGGLSLLGNSYAMGQQKLNLPRFQQNIDFSSTGQPSYNGEQQNMVSGTRIQRGATGAEIGGAAATGASAGAVAGPWGAAVGAVVGAGAAIGGGAIRAQKQRHQKEVAANQVAGYQKNFNDASRTADSNSNAQLDYQRRMRNMNNFNNLYRLPSQYSQYG